MFRAADRNAYRRYVASRAAQTFVLACALLILSAIATVAQSQQQLPAIQRQVPQWGITRLPGDFPDTAAAPSRSGLDAARVCADVHQRPEPHAMHWSMHSTRRDDCLRIGEAEILLPVPDPGDTLKLPHRLVSPCQLRVTQESTVFQVGRDYRLDPVAGQLFWLGARPTRASPLRVRYRYLPLAIAGYWERVRWAASPETLTIASLPTEPEPSLPPGARLQVGGSKTFSLEFGNRQDVDFSQSLDLTIRGQLAEQVEIRAILTDRNMPLQPEGTTAELTDLDQVLIEVTSPWGELRLGDLSVREEGFRFLAHQRAMEGLLLRAGRPVGPHGAGALGRGLGQPRSKQFFGESGKQGPYQMLPNRSSLDALMVAGSERIWLDGVRLRRGEDADYRIDYSAAEVWFTARHPITAASEVRVDFQVRAGAFERNYYWLSAGAGDTEAGLAVAWLREQDDPENSPTISLDAEERSALSAAGDSATAALEGGVHWVGPGEGPYELVESDTLETDVFLYLGEQDGVYLGSYEVTFSGVGAGKGDYRDSTLVDGTIIYVYVGRKQGTYLPGRRLPLPEAHDLLALRAAGDLGYGLNLSAESAISWHDRNILSSRDDGDNVGAALTAQGTWGLAELVGGRPDLAQLRFRYRGVQQEFSSSEPLDEAFYYRRWNAPAEILDGRDQRGALGLRLRPWKSVALDGEFERLEAPKGFSGRRWHLLSQRTGRLHALAELWLGQSRCDAAPGTEQRRRARLGWSDQVELEACYDAEDLRRGDGHTEQGESYDQLSLRLASGRLAPWLYASALTRVRWDYE
ncbi:MAG: hypothetical protein KAY24_19090, partial [Candidatus Eisenbacteria sp.]|nr:hypothetical protein [Candidatus Eisenbacteria bacterium]